MAAVMTPAEFAVEVDSDGRTVRKFLRSITPKEDQPGKGSRWSLPATKREVNALKKKFGEWSEAQEKARTERAEKAAEVEEIEEPAVDEVELDD